MEAMVCAVLGFIARVPNSRPKQLRHLHRKKQS